MIFSGSLESKSQTVRDSTCFTLEETKRISKALADCAEVARDYQLILTSYDLCRSETEILKLVIEGEKALCERTNGAYLQLKRDLSDAMKTRRKWRKARFTLLNEFSK